MSFPNLPGVPKLLPTAKTATAAVFGVIQGTGWRYISNPKDKQWGIFKEVKNASGDTELEPLFAPEPIFSSGKIQALNDIASRLASTLGLLEEPSFNSMEFSKEYRVSNFPIEGGGFASYNKVEMPGSVVVTMCMGGSDKEQERFLNLLIGKNGAAGSTDTYTIATPKWKYVNYNIHRVAYAHHSDNGADLLIVALDITEVRSVKAVRTIGEKKVPVVNAKEAAGATKKDLGRVQPSAAKDSTLKKLNDTVFKPAVDLVKSKIGSAISRFF